MTKAESEHLDHISSLGCCICGNSYVEIHHVREFGEKRKHSKVIPLCVFHHRGKEGIHHLGKKEWRRRYGNECDYLSGGRFGTN